MKMESVCVSVIALVGLAFSGGCYAADCNPRAQVHQQRAANIKLAMDLNNRIPNAEEEAFMLCMYSEKEDKQAFEQRVRALRAYAAGQPARDAAERDRRRAAEVVAQRQRAEQAAATASLDAKIQACRQMANNRPGFVQQGFIFNCENAWRAAPQATCSINSVPCGQQCVDPNSHGEIEFPICMGGGTVQWAHVKP